MDEKKLKGEDHVACVDCFNNAGFKKAIRNQSHEVAECARCHTNSWVITESGLKEAIYSFFVDGSFLPETITSVYQVNDSNPHPAKFDATLSSDALKASKISNLIIFEYGPPLWRFGETNLKNDIEEGGNVAKKAIQEFLQITPKLTLSKGTLLYRVRINPDLNLNAPLKADFDPPPETVVREPGRWDNGIDPILYVSDDIELCIHECRASIADEIVVATLRLEEPVTLLDFAAQIPCEPCSPFEDPNIFSTFLSLSRGQEWLEHSRIIARDAKELGVSGIQYRSYYSQVKQDRKPRNIALYGRLLADGKMTVQSVNRLRLTDAKYQFVLGPVLNAGQVA